MIKLKQINNKVVNPIKIPIIEIKNITGYSILPDPYCNVFLVAKKKSGKTNAIFKILKECANKHSTVIIFSSTIYKDSNWIEITKWLKKNKIPTETYTSIFDDGINQVEALVEDLKIENKPNEKEEKKVKIKFIECNNDSDQECKERKSKKIVAEYILVFDDLSNELHNKYLTYLTKMNRHMKMKILISSQYYLDIEKSARLQMDYILIFPNIPLEKLETIHKEIDISTPFNIYLELYRNATKEKYNFLYVSIRDETFRKNFNYQYVIEE